MKKEHANETERERENILLFIPVGERERGEI
jgi:hypothetical protein